MSWQVRCSRCASGPALLHPRPNILKISPHIVEVPLGMSGVVTGVVVSLILRSFWCRSCGVRCCGGSGVAVTLVWKVWCQVAVNLVQKVLHRLYCCAHSGAEAVVTGVVASLVLRSCWAGSCRSAAAARRQGHHQRHRLPAVIRCPWCASVRQPGSICPPASVYPF